MSTRPLTLIAALCLGIGMVTLSGQQPPPRTTSPAARRAPVDPPLLRREERVRRAPGASGVESVSPTVFDGQGQPDGGQGPKHEPREQRMQRAGSFNGDLRSLTDTGPVRRRERPERQNKPRPAPVELIPAGQPGPSAPTPSGIEPPQALNAPAPPTLANFEGLDYDTWGAGHPPDTNGDVGPTYFIQSLNTSIGIYEKDGDFVTAFTFDAFMSQGNFGNLCDTDNFGDPVVLYDTFEDRWVISDFAFTLDGQNNVVNPPGAFQCFAVSKTGDPLTGGWNFYSINTWGGLGDYPKLGIWPDGLYLSVNMFDYAANGSFQNVRLYALNKAQMYAGAPWIQIVGFDLPAGEFTVLPSNARLQTGTPPPGSPNYFASVWNYLNVVGVWKFHVDWNSITNTSLSGPFNSLTATNWSQLTNPSVPSPAPGNDLDTLYPRLMMQNQYTNVGGTESLWNSHTVGAAGVSSAQAAVRYYQVNVTAGAVAPNATQAFTYSPDATHRFMPSVAVDNAGNMAIGYSATSSSVYPAIRYAGRLAGDSPNTITQTEATLFAGDSTQDGNCGPSSCERWGDYSTMTLDPNGCTFWYTNQYYEDTGLSYLTRIGAFSFASCTPVGLGSLQGTVKTAAAVPIAGATVMLGSRTATTDAGGNYSFSDLPAGTYPGATASFPGYVASTFSTIVVPSGGTATRDFVLSQAPQAGCLTDTTQADFQAGTSNCDLTGSPGDVTLVNQPTIDQQNFTITNNGFGFSNTNWAGQTFTPAASGALTRVDLFLFCAGCSGSTSDLTVSIRATSGSPPVPTGPDLAVATILAFSSGAGGFFPALFASPATLTAGTRYAVIIRAVSPVSAGTYAYACSCEDPPGPPGGAENTNPYASGQRVTSVNGGGLWSADTTVGGRDLGFVTYMESGFASSGIFESSLKDANPAPGVAVMWGTLSWTATTPAGTAVQFQAAAGNNAAGPFWFVGPDGTPGTFFSNGASLAQFNGNRYLKYRAELTTSNSSVTPAIHDVTVCFNNATPPSASLDPGFLWFGKRRVGSTSPPQTVTLTNSGPGSLVISTFDGAPAASVFSIGDFQATTTCPVAPAGLAPGLSCTLTFQFSPTGNGSRFQFLSIGSNAATPLFLSLDGIGFTIDEAGVAQLVGNGGIRLQNLQNADGGWFGSPFSSSCAPGPGSCPNLIGVTGLGLLAAWERTTEPVLKAALLADAVQAGNLLESIHTADPSQQPYSQDLEFLVALSNASGDPDYAALADVWFDTIKNGHASAAARVDWAFARREPRLRTLAVWDVASTIRSAKAAGEPEYAIALANQVIARQDDWLDVNPLHRWDMCETSGGCGPPDNPRAFDYTLIGMGSFLWAIHDLAGFQTEIDAYSAWLLSQQDAEGSWNLGNLQITAYAGMGLGAVGVPGADIAIARAVEFFFVNENVGGGWPFLVTDGVPGPEFTYVNSEVMRGVAMMFSTQAGEGVMVSPAQLASVTFSTVIAPGMTTVVARTTASAARVPNGYQLVSGLSYQVATTASIKGDSIVCLSVPWDALAGKFDDLRLLQIDQPGRGNEKFVDRTILKGPNAPNAAAKRLCAEVPTLDPIVVSIRNRGK